MKTPNKVIIDLEKGKVILETGTSVTVADQITELIYCQNTDDDKMSISISMNIPLNETTTEGVDESVIELAKEEAMLASPRILHVEEADAIAGINVDVDYKKIESMFKEMLRLPGDDHIAVDFVRYTIEGKHAEIFDFKKELFKDAMKDPRTTEDKKEWLKKNKIRLFNSKRRLDM